MPVTLESVGDESNIDDFENRRFYVQPFEMLLAGYILDENDFEVIPTINRAMVMSEISSDPAKARTSEKNVNTRGPIVAVQGNVRVVNTIGNFISTVPCNEQYVVQNSTISNSGNTYSVSLPATVNLSLPNVTHYGSDGQPVELPAMVGFTAQTCVYYQVLSDWVSGATGTSISYMAYALEGTLTSENWTITRITIALDGTQISEEAIGPWDDRYILIYT
jgi:hypothetical protein